MGDMPRPKGVTYVLTGPLGRPIANSYNRWQMTNCRRVDKNFTNFFNHGPVGAPAFVQLRRDESAWQVDMDECRCNSAISAAIPV